MRLRTVIVALGLLACGDAPAATSAPAAPAAPVAVAPAAVTAAPVIDEAASRSFGAPLAETARAVDLASLLADPAPHVGQVVRTIGNVARVCEKAGCWLELRPEGGAEGVRVPMAGHAFFIPQDAVGHRAEVQGSVSAEELSADAREHLQGEGAKAVGPLAIEATGVVVY